MTPGQDGAPGWEALTWRHIHRVQGLLLRCARQLSVRAERHDQSKFSDEEAPTFARVTGQLAGLEYGSEEYRAALEEMAPALEHHYAANDHHPEHFAEGVAGSLVTVHLCPRGCGYGDTVGGRCGVCGARLRGEARALVREQGAIHEMDLVQLLEMVCDWVAASERHESGSVAESIEKNRERFGYGDELARLLHNTASRLGRS